MAKEKTYRLNKVAAELNVSWKNLIEHLVKNDYQVDEKLNAKISQEMYDFLQTKFQSDKKAKEESQSLKEIFKKPKETKTAEDNKESQPTPPPKKDEGLDDDIVLIKNVGVAPKVEEVEETPPKKEEQTPKKEEAPQQEAPKEPVKEEPPKVEEKPVEKPEPPVEVKKEEEKPKEETPAAPEPQKEEDKKVPGIKVLGKIDLGKDKPKKKEEPKPEPKEEKKEAPKAKDVEKKTEKPKPKEEPKPKPEVKDKAPETSVETPVETADKTEEGEESPNVKTEYKQLKGLSIKGKIDLPKPAEKKKGDKEDGDGKRKRKRKKIGAEKVDPGKVDAQKGRKRKRKRKDDSKEEISDKEIQDKIKATMAKLSGQRGSAHGGNIRSKMRRQRRDTQRQQREEQEIQKELDSRIVKVTEFVTANDLANLMDISVNKIIQACFTLGMMVSINQRLDAETIQVLASEFDYEVEFVDAEDQVDIIEVEDAPEDLEPRAPIVTVMGHVDHGKTSLLDYVRSTNVIAGEAGGITQHVAAYEVTIEGGKNITFVDTPGHEAFTAMRARGAKATDIAIIVIAADDSIMPQTKEAISHAQAAEVPIVFAFNKIDKPTANPDRIREELSAMNLLVEEWGGKYQAQEISAKKGTGVPELLEKVLLEAELLELKANPNKRAKGTVMEARLDKGRGIVASVLVQEGTLKMGDCLIAGPHFARIKAMFDERGNRLEEAGPSTPVGMLGFNGAPTAGDLFQVMETEQEAKEIATKREKLIREQGIRASKHITLEEIGRRLAIGNFRELNLIVKGDVDGSVEALSDSLLKLSTEEVQVNIIHKSVGQIIESDVLLASASDAIIVGFQVRPAANARKLAEQEQIEIKTYSVIYKAIDEVKAAMEGMLAPEFEEKIMGNLEIREVFKISKVGAVAGCMVTDGKVRRDAKIRLIRDGVVVYSGTLASLKRFKDDVKEVSKGYECGTQVKNYNDIKEGDIIEAFEEVEVKRKL